MSPPPQRDVSVYVSMSLGLFRWLVNWVGERVVVVCGCVCLCVGMFVCECVWVCLYFGERVSVCLSIYLSIRVGGKVIVCKGVHVGVPAPVHL